MGQLIEFIYFDVGWVIIYDFSWNSKWDDMLSDLWLSEEEKLNFQEQWKIYEPMLCNWALWTEDFIDHFSRTYKVTFPKNYSMLDDFVFRFEKNHWLNWLVLELKKRYKMGLLTNMYEGMLERIKIRGLLPEVNWDSIIDSSKEWCRKPEEKIYWIAENIAWTKGSSILFIDNKEENLIPARELWWQTLLYNPNKSDESDIQIKWLLL